MKHDFDYEMTGGKEVLNEEDLGRLFVDSSNIKSFWYKDGEYGLGTLWVEFLSGAVYEYYRVPEVVAQAFTNAPSYGRFLWKNIRDKYPYKRVDANKAIANIGKNTKKKKPEKKSK